LRSNIVTFTIIIVAISFFDPSDTRTNGTDVPAPLNNLSFPFPPVPQSSRRASQREINLDDLENEKNTLQKEATLSIDAAQDLMKIFIGSSIAAIALASFDLLNDNGSTCYWSGACKLLTSNSTTNSRYTNNSSRCKWNQICS
jgi:hypothetical protein